MTLKMSTSGGSDTTARSLVDVDRGEISREIFTDASIFNRELEYLFPRSWLFVGHASQVSAPGQFFSSRMGSDPVLLTRDAQGGVNVLS